jgi:hypothetical protein
MLHGPLVETMATPNPTADIPLYIFPDTSGGYKIGINVSLNGGQTYQMYEFDTGGQGFWSAYNPAWFTNAVAPDDVVTSNTYSSGITYDAQVVTEPITIQATIPGPAGPTPTLLTVNTGTVAAIESADKPTNPDPFTNQQFQNDISSTPPVPPIYNTFFGDFGMALGSSSDGLLGILPQLVGYSNGFIVNLGTYPTSNTPINQQGYVQIGTLQVGLTTQDIASFPTLISMQGSNAATLFPGTGEPTYTERLGAGNVAITNGTVSYSAATSFVFDTGAPSTEVHPNTTEATDLAPIIDNNGNLVAGTTFAVSSPGATQPVPPGTLAANWQTNFPTGGNQPGLNQIGIASADSGTGYVNTGLQPFFQGEVMYDVHDGIIGFNAISCFTAGTRIATPAGERPIDALCIGDLVCTASGPTRMIVWIGHRRVACHRHADPASVLPIRIAADAFASGQPARNLLLSPDHAVLFDGVLIPIKHLLDDDTVRQVPACEVTYFHIELEQHDIVLADGLPAESYLDTGSRTAFANGGGAVQLHPAFAPAPSQTSLCWEAGGFAPLVVSGPQVEHARRLLRRRSRLSRRRAGR